MEPKIGDRMKVSPQLTDQADWIDGEVIDVEHNPFMGLVISIKDKLRSKSFLCCTLIQMFAIAFDMANLFAAIYALKKIAWFKASVRDIRAFKVENWSDFTQIVKEDD